jgi:trimethylamine--corrinoid protein Co-methyltransferase
MFGPDLTFRPRMSVLNAEQAEQIHQATLELLERTGVQITHPRGLQLLHGAGAHVDSSKATRFGSDRASTASITWTP